MATGVLRSEAGASLRCSKVSFVREKLILCINKRVSVPGCRGLSTGFIPNLEGSVFWPQWRARTTVVRKRI